MTCFHGIATCTVSSSPLLLAKAAMHLPGRAGRSSKGGLVGAARPARPPVGVQKGDANTRQKDPA